MMEMVVIVVMIEIYAVQLLNGWTNKQVSLGRGMDLVVSERMRKFMFLVC